MTKINVRLTFEDESMPVRTFERDAQVNRPPMIDGERSLWENISSELDAELDLNGNYDALPDVSGVYVPGNLTYSLEDLETSAYFDRRNTRWVWLEISNILAQARFLLARAKTYKDVEPPRNPPCQHL